MKLFPKNNISDQKNHGTALSADHKIDADKLKNFEKEHLCGLESYALFQRFSFFNWPAWITLSADRNSGFFSQLTPPFLLNRSYREWISFNNFLSNDELHIDPSAMISPSYGRWSIEIWILSDNKIFRPQENPDAVSCVRNTENATLGFMWDAWAIQVEEVFYGARSSINEALCTLTLKNNSKKKDTSCLIVFRPYNNVGLGGLKEISHSRETGLVSLNQQQSVCIDRNPDFYLAGNGISGDVRPEDFNDTASSSCENGMATFALGYNLQKGENIINMRISLDGSSKLESAVLNYTDARKEYEEFSGLMLKKGMNISLSDKKIMNSFYASKLSVVSLKVDNGSRMFDLSESRKIFYYVSACCRMGYYSEALNLLDFPIVLSKQEKKNLSFTSCVCAAYILLAYGEYFIHTRTLDFLQNCYPALKDLAFCISRCLNNSDHLHNSLSYYLGIGDKKHDLVLLASSLRVFSYLARCMGIFGDEKKNSEEADKYEAEFFAYLDSCYTDRNTKDQFFYLDLYAGFPFGMSCFNDNKIRMILDEVISIQGNFPVHAQSIGYDVMATLAGAHNMLLLKDPMVYDVLEWIYDTAAERYSLPEYIDPSTGKGCFGEADCRENSAMLFMLVRSIFFVDWPERLEIFPVAVAKWFSPGEEIKITGAPSRFGEINIRISSTENEVHFYFEELPKFVPPDILINLPFKAKLDSGDDYILKRHEGNSWILNGWPSDLRFLKK